MFGSPYIRLTFVVDVNGEASPNKIGRDVFYFYIDPVSGKVLPYNMKDTSDCTTERKGNSCAARIIKEGKMNY